MGYSHRPLHTPPPPLRFVLESNSADSETQALAGVAQTQALLAGVAIFTIALRATNNKPPTHSILPYLQPHRSRVFPPSSKGEKTQTVPTSNSSPR